MRIRIKHADNPRGLRLISCIPNQRVGLIEGPNGIGKSLAIELLRLATGDQPWTDAQLWISLRDALMETEVEIFVDGLRTGRSLAAKFTPEAWPDDPPPQPDDAIAVVTVDGAAVSLSEVGQVLEVVRFGGNEDLQAVARQELSRESARFDADAVHFEATLEYLREKSRGVADLLRDARPDEHSAVEKKIADREKESDEGSALLENLEEERDQLALGLKLRGALSGGDQDADQKRQGLAAVETEISGVEADLETVESELAALLETLSSSSDPQSRLKEAERRSRTRGKTLASRRKKEADLAARLGLDDRFDHDQIATSVSDLRSERDRLDRELRSLDAGSRVVTFIDEISPALEALIDEGLGDQIVLAVDEVAISAVELRQALRGREAEIGEEKSPARAIELQGEIAKVSRRLHDFQELKTALSATERAEENLQSATDELVNARKALGQAKGELARYDELTKERDALMASLKQAIDRAVKLRSDLGAPQLASKKQVEEELNALLADRDIALEDLPSRFAQVDQEIGEMRRLIEDAASGLEAARRERDQAQSRIRFAVRQLETDPEYGPAWEALGSPGPSTGESGRALSQLAQRAQSYADRVEKTLNTTQAVRALLKEIAKGSEARDIGSEDLANAIYASLNERLRRRLSSPAISEALFGNEELRSVDLRNGTVRWGSGEKQTVRPIESFSTGEQAFAFTQARIMALDELPDGRDRLLALDEFGAFVAANRRGLLADFLGSDAVQARASQVLVVLPLRSNYKDELPETSGRLQELYERRIAQLEREGYIAEPFDMGAVA